MQETRNKQARAYIKLHSRRKNGFDCEHPHKGSCGGITAAARRFSKTEGQFTIVESSGALENLSNKW